MSQSGQNGNQKKKSPGTPPVYGTQVAGFGTPAAGELPREPVSAERQAVAVPAQRASFGTRMAPEIRELVESTAVSAAEQALSRPLPSLSSLKNITKTQRADGGQLSMLTQFARAQQNQNRESEKATVQDNAQRTVALGPARAIEPSANRPAGKSTWNLRIHKRDVAGHISGIINPIPRDSKGTTGLQSALAIDDTAAEYEILGELGAGNMGIVYRARQMSLNRELAIKTLKPDSTQVDHDQAMFVSEAVVTANLVHPNIVPIHDLGRTADGKLFYSMKKVTGVSWNDIVRDRALEDNLDIFMKLCDAVAYAHSKGVINRDLKPENVVVGEYGEVIVLDWGLAITNERFEKQNSVVFEFRGSAGTPVYMPPELIDEDVAVVGVHSDVYLLGAILFEVLEGFPPHLLRQFWTLEDPEDQLSSVIWAVVHNEIEKDVVNKGELMNIARKAMSTLPEDRYASVEELQEAIRQYRITGRAEELLKSVDSSVADDYGNYQGAVALYAEALRKWPDNRRAIDGDRRARLAYAELAHKKGDIDLGLQVVSGKRDAEFQAVASRLRKSRLARRIVRGTWGVMSVTAITLFFVSTFFWFQADLAKEELIAKNGEVDVLEKKKVELEAASKTAVEEAQAAAQAAEDARIKMADLQVQADQKQKEAEEASRLAMEATKEAAQQKEAAALSQTQALEANEKAAAANRQAAEANAQAQAASTKAADATEQLQLARNEMYEVEVTGFMSRINASEELGDFTELISVVREALANAEKNPKIAEKRETLEKKISDAIEKGGNAELPIDHKPDSASISANGRTVVTYSRGAGNRLSAFRLSDGVNSAPVWKISALEPPKGVIRNLAVSSDGSAFCGVGKEEKQLWQLKNDEFVQLPLEKYFPASRFAAGNRTFRKALFSGDGQSLVLLGADEKGTVEIYNIGDGKATLQMRQTLSGAADYGFELRDGVLLPDAGCLIVQTEKQECYSFYLAKKDGKLGFVHLSTAAPKLDLADDHLKLGLASNKPGRLFLSDDGQYLAMTYNSKVVVLPRNPKATVGEFPFLSPSSVPSLVPVACSFDVTDLCFSADSSRLVTGHNKRYIQVWDRSGDGWIACAAEGLYRHKADDNTSLRGHHSLIHCVRFIDNSNDHLISSAADKSVRTWEISSYGEYTSMMGQLGEAFKAASAAQPVTSQKRPDWNDWSVPVFVSTGSADPTARMSSDDTDEASLPAAPSNPLTRKRPVSVRSMVQQTALAQTETAVRAPAAKTQTTPIRFRQGRGVFSVQFSADSQRILAGTDDLAAHVFDSRTGKRVTLSPMGGRKDLFFDPDRNNFLEGHISEIASVRFLPPRGEMLLTADYFGSISVWDASPGANGIGYERSRLLSEYSFSEFAVSDDGALILAGGARTDEMSSLRDADLEHMGVLWRAADILNSAAPEPYRVLRGQHPQFAITAVAIAPSGKRVVTAGRRGRIVVWNVDDLKVVASVPESHNRDQVSGIFFESEDQLVSVGYDGRIYRWSITDDSLVSTEITRPEGISLPQFIVRLRPSPDHRQFATSEVSVTMSPGRIRTGSLNIVIWTPEGPRPLLKSPVNIPDSDREKAFRHDVSWSSDGRELMLVSDGVITIYSTADWKIIRKYRQDVEDVRSVRGAFAPEIENSSPRVATFDGRFTHLWDLVSGEHLAEFRSHAQYNIAVSYSADRRWVATASESLRLFDADETSANHGRTAFRLPVGEVHRSPLSDVAFNPRPGDNHLVTIDNQGILELWKWSPEAEVPLAAIARPVPEEMPISPWAEDVQAGNAVAWHPQGEIFASLQLGNLRVWRTGNQLVPVAVPLPEGRECRFNRIAFSKREGLLAAGGVVWESDREEMKSFGAVWRISDEGVKLVGMIEEGHSVDVASRLGRTGITAIAFNESQNEIVTGGADNQLIRWQVAGLNAVNPPVLDRIASMLLENREPHTSAVMAVDVSEDGRIVSADEDGFMIIWPAR